MYAFGKKIKELRKQQCLTIADLAEKAGTSKGYISDIENTNRLPPSDKVVRKLARVLKADKKILLRLAHIDKIPKDIRQELQVSKIITPRSLLEENSPDLGSILKDGEKKRRRSVGSPQGYIPIINQISPVYPNGFSSFADLVKETNDFVQFSLAGIKVSFAIQLIDVTMERKLSPSFEEGALVFFSENAKVKKEDFVFVVYQEGTELTTTFRQLKEYDRSKVQLTALNPRYRKDITLNRRMMKEIYKAIGYLKLYNI